ncbi:M56 family metallopeptidase [Leucobacter albus]|uniref:M56 family metallopeptidase n=1 Tax=Leucobacter albus TaxID=272210 RepID=A0ABW3TLS1_9MICO
MTATLSALLLSGAVLAAALGGPALLRRAAPALSAVPRVAALLLTLAGLLWITALVAIGPVVALMSSGPAWLPEQAAAVCGRCLSAAAPIAGSGLTLGIPAVVPLAIPALGALAVGAGLVVEFRSLRATQRRYGAALRATSDAVTVLGSRARVTREGDLRAFSLPHRHGGIVLSRGTLGALSPAELAAVLAHEAAHLDQRHHFALGVLNGATRWFRWVPLVRAIRDAVPHYLEIAADQVAQRSAGTRALAGALLKLGSGPHAEGPHGEGAQGAAASGVGAPGALGTGIPAHAVLHAAGSERIRHLVGAPRPRASTALAAAVGAYACMLAGVVFAVQLPYVVAVLTGCFVQ